MAIKIQKIKGKRIRPKHLYKIRFDFMIGDADSYYNTEQEFNPDSKEDSYAFERLVRTFKRSTGNYDKTRQEAADYIKESLEKDERFCNWVAEGWGSEGPVSINDYFGENLEWGCCEYSGDYHRLESIDYWYIDESGDKCKVSFTGTMKL